MRDLPMGVTIRHTGDFNKLEKFLNKVLRRDYLNILSKYGERGVAVLASATPKESGMTANSWGYEIVQSNGSVSICWTNSNENKGVNIAVILQYGHGTGTGGYVQGIDYINPAIRPIFDKISSDAWREVTQS